MFRLKATLVAMARMRPWRTGWSIDRGADITLMEATRPLSTPSAARGPETAAEPACFIDEDWATSPGAAMVHSIASPTADEPVIEPPSGDAPEAPGVRAWWSLASKTSQT